MLPYSIAGGHRVESCYWTFRLVYRKKHTSSVTNNVAYRQTIDVRCSNGGCALALNECSDKDPQQVSTIRISSGQSNVFVFYPLCLEMDMISPREKEPYVALIGIDWADQKHDYCLGVVGRDAVEVGTIASCPEDVAA
jgi:hypothetical protein